MADVVMPQMGESVAEGTIVRWIKKAGERVDRDEPLFEISTDKVDAEIPSPAAGVLVEIRAKEGETVPVNSVVAVIGEPGTAGPTAPAEGPAAGGRHKTSPLVRRMAREHGIDLAAVAGSGLGGRVTKDDVLAFLNLGGTAAAGPVAAAESAHAPEIKAGGTVDIVPMSMMRRKIAEHMVLSRRTSAHVHSVFEVDYTRVSKIRAARKDDYERQGVKLGYMSFLMKAAVDALKAVPVINSSLDGASIVYRKDINLGIAVALDWGLIVPVIAHAEEKNVLGLSRALQDLSSRARAKQLKPEEVQGGTFTITNPGSYGALFGTPIISQPQVAILDVGVIEKRVAVIEDAIAIRTKGYLCLGFDHRLIDGAVADQFLSRIKNTLENFDPDDI
jgi:pyruvate dehydrogenase E2 component (dihydrolipoamide acetyltransferase)